VDELYEQWESIKAKEKKNGTATQKGVLKDLPPSLPALSFARDVYKQIKKKKLGIEGMIEVGELEELSEGMDEELAGEMLFDLVAACNYVGVEPESALRRYTNRIIERVEDQYGK